MNYHHVWDEDTPLMGRRCTTTEHSEMVLMEAASSLCITTPQLGLPHVEKNTPSRNGNAELLSPRMRKDNLSWHYSSNGRSTLVLHPFEERTPCPGTASAPLWNFIYFCHDGICTLFGDDKTLRSYSGSCGSHSVFGIV